jgi:hypothetical protein
LQEALHPDRFCQCVNFLRPQFPQAINHHLDAVEIKIAKGASSVRQWQGPPFASAPR